MSWLKVDDGLSDHPKVIAAGGDAAWLFICGLCYVARQLTDGFIPANVLGRLSDRKNPAKLAEKLVHVGLWERTDGGFRIHNYLKHNPTADEVRRRRAEKSEAGKVAAAKRWQTDSRTHGSSHASGIATAMHPSHPIPTPPTPSSPDPKFPPPPSDARAREGGDESSPEAQRAEASTLDEPKAAKDNVFDLAQTIYGEAFKKRHGRDFVLSSFGHQGSDEWAFVRIGRLARERLPEDPERWLRHVIAAYLKDDERWLVDNAHPPRTLERRLNKYGEPKKAKPPAPAKPPEPEAPKEPEAPFTPLPKVSPKEIRRAPESKPEDLGERVRDAKERLAKAFGPSETNGATSETEST
jgi:hypothetical protein